MTRLHDLLMHSFKVWIHMKSKFCVMKYATLCPSPESSRPPPLHYTKGKGCRGREREREREIGEPLVFTHRSPLFLRPTAATAATTRYCQTPDGRTAVRPRPYMHPQRAAEYRGQREGLDGWSHNELGLETTLGPDDPILGRQSDEDEFKI